MERKTWNLQSTKGSGQKSDVQFVKISQGEGQLWEMAVNVNYSVDYRHKDSF